MSPPRITLLALLALALWIATAPASPPIRDQYEAFPPVRVVHAPWLHLLPHKDGLTVGRVIFYRDAVPRPYLLAHEYAHVRQYQRHGIAGFLRSYLRHPAALELDARRDAYPTCAELSDVVPPAICADERQVTAPTPPTAPPPSTGAATRSAPGAGRAGPAPRARRPRRLAPAAPRSGPGPAGESAAASGRCRRPGASERGA